VNRRLRHIEPVCDLDRRDPRLGHAAVGLHPADSEHERAVFAVGVLIADGLIERAPRPLVVERVQERVADRMALVGWDLVGEVFAQLAPEMPFALTMLELSIAEQLWIAKGSALSASLTITLGAPSRPRKNVSQAA
jgi:hypothetical protein